MSYTLLILHNFAEGFEFNSSTDGPLAEPLDENIKKYINIETR